MAKHARDRNKHIVENVDENNPFGSGLDEVTISEILDVDESKRKQLDELADKVYEVVESTRSRMLESGLISQEAYDALKEVESYVPLTNFEDESIEVSSIMQGNDISIKGKEWKQAKGRTTKAGNILVNMLQQGTAVEIRAAKNELLKTIHDIIVKNPDSDIAKVYTPETLPKQKILVTANNPKYVGVKVDGEQKYIRFENDLLAENIQNTTNAQVGDIFKNLSKINNYLRAMITTWNPEFMLGNFFRDLATGIIHLQGQQDLNVDLDGKKITKEAIALVPKAIKQIAKFEIGKKGQDTKLGKMYQEYIKDGAKTGWTQQTKYEDLVKDLKKASNLEGEKSVSKRIGTVKNFVEGLNTSVENGIRFAAYVSARNNGVSREAAASLSKELTVNFNRKGEAGAVLNAMYLFSNTAIQGTMTMARNLTHRRSWVDVNGKKRKSLTGAQKMAGALTVMGGLLPLLNRALADEDEEGVSEYDKIQDFVKERNIVVMVGGSDYITIPLPYGYNVFYNAGEMISDVATSNRDLSDASSFLWAATLGSFMPVPVAKRDTFLETAGTSIIPTEPIRFITDIYANKNYLNRDIHRKPSAWAKGEVPDSSLPKKNTPEWAKWTTGLLNDVTGGSSVSKGLIDINPETLIYTIHKALGGVGKFAERSYSLGETLILNNTGEASSKGKAAMSKYNVDGNKEIEAYTIPFVRKFWGESSEMYYANEYYEIQNKVYTDFNVMKLDLSDRGITKQVQMSSKEVKDYRKLKETISVLKKVDKKLKELRNSEKKVYKLDNSKDIQIFMNVIEDKKTDLYKKAYKEHNKKN